MAETKMHRLFHGADLPAIDLITDGFLTIARDHAFQSHILLVISGVHLGPLSNY